MPNLSDMDFETSRPPFVPPGPGADEPGPAIKYTFVGEFSEDFPTDGAPRRFYSVVRVKAQDKDPFLRAILPDVYEVPNPPLADQVLRMSAFDSDVVTPIDYRRNELVRFAPERHPTHPKAWVVGATVLGGDGFPGKPDDGLGMQFFRYYNSDTYKVPGFVRIGITWQDLPYDPDPFQDSDAACNEPFYSEIARYCVFKPSPRGQNLTLPGGQFYFVDDNGSLVLSSSRPTWTASTAYSVNAIVTPPVVNGYTYICRSSGTSGGSSPVWPTGDGEEVNDGSCVWRRRQPESTNRRALTVAESQVLFVPSTAFTITLKMVPRVPLAAELMRGMVNEFDDIPIPTEILKDKPDVGTLLYTGYELSDPYYTVSDRKVFDIHYTLVHRLGGKDKNRGWNSAYCPIRREFRRIVAGQLVNNAIVRRMSDGAILNFPVTGDDSDQSFRAVIAGGNMHDFADLQNLFRFEADRIQDAYPAD